MNYIIQKTEKWPKNWEKHILNTCKFYFEDKNIDFIDGIEYFQINTQDINKIVKLELYFNINDYKYKVHIENYLETYKNGKMVVYIFYYNMIEETKFNIYYEIAGFSSDNRLDTIKMIELLITSNYNDRNDDWEGENDNETEPISPINTLELLTC